MLEGHLIGTGFIKVQVDSVDEKYGAVLLLEETRTEEIQIISDLPVNFVQWPIFAIKVDPVTVRRQSRSLPSQNQSRSSPMQNLEVAASSCYKPIMFNREPTAKIQQQTVAVQQQQLADQSDAEFEELFTYPQTNLAIRNEETNP